MALDSELNSILKEMWRLDEMIQEGEVLSDKEIEFYDNHLEIIKNYYIKNSNYWNNK